MKQYVTHETGSAQTLSEVQNTNVVVYDTKADAEADLSNLSEGQIVATKDSGDELAQPVDTIASGNMHAVTSNAVANSNAMPVDVIASGNMHAVTSNAVANSNAMPVDQVALNNLHSITSGAVYSKINELLYQDHYNANTDRTNIENRKQAILHVIKNFPSSMFTIRYLDGYYIFYIANPFFTAERTVLEINNYDGEINIYQINPLNTTISLVRSI